MHITADIDETAAREELSRLLAHRLFSKSRRTPAFLRYVVEKTLDGKAGELKERTIGVEVFGRPPDYDVAADPIVRITAAETRKRLAQYYVDNQNTTELRIAVTVGSYIPSFESPGLRTPSMVSDFSDHHEQANEREPADSSVTAVDEDAPRPKARFRLSSAIWIFLGGVSTILLLLFVLHRSLPAERLSSGGGGTDMLQTFWAAEFGSTQPILFCVGSDGKTIRSPLDDGQANRSVPIDTSIALMRIAAPLNRENKPYRVLLASEVTFPQLRMGPFVLVGAAGNPWTLKMTQGLPFTFLTESDGSLTIVDNQSHEHTRWSMQPGVAEFAILARLRDPSTQQAEIIVAASSPAGTEAASGFLATPTQASRLVADAPQDWDRGNFEAIVRMNIVNGMPGAPTVIRTAYWPSIFK